MDRIPAYLWTTVFFQGALSLVAEMVKAGCLVWVPAGGGQTEIVGRSELIYSGREDAVGKIGRVLRDGNL